MLGNLFGTVRRVALGMGVDAEDPFAALREIGRLLASLREPEPPRGLEGRMGEAAAAEDGALDGAAGSDRRALPGNVWLKARTSTSARLPIQTCWPGDVAPLITWGLTVTRGPNRRRQNLGIYRQQVIARNKVIMRWLAHRGGALDYRDHCLARPREPFPVAVALGADPATLLGAVTPVPDTLSEYQFAGLLRGSKTEIVKCRGFDLQVPAGAEIVLEGSIHPGETALEGPFGDHTGYYNEQARFPVLTIDRITTRRDPIYHSTYTGKPPDEPAVLGLALNEVFVPLLTRQFPEIADFYLPPEGCSYRIAVRQHEEAVPGPRPARDVRHLELPAPIPVHQVHHRHRRRRQRPRLEGSGVGARDASRSASRHPDHGAHAGRLSRFREPGARAGLQDGNRCYPQVAGRNRPPLGRNNCNERGSEAARGRAVARAGAVGWKHGGRRRRAAVTRISAADSRRRPRGCRSTPAAHPAPLARSQRSGG